MRIIIDDREDRSGIGELLEIRGHEVSRKRLPFGDYLIDGKLVVERKTANDFVISIIDGRLFRQIHNLKRLRLRVVLIIEGDPYRTGHAIDLNAVRGALISISVVWQVPVIFSSSTEDFTEQLQVMASQMESCRSVMPLRGGYRPRRLKSRQLFILQGLPGVGGKLAWRLLSHFKSVADVFSAGTDELVAVDGIGHVSAERIREVLDIRIK
jgi:Fanconi anemia group M protein